MAYSNWPSAPTLPQKLQIEGHNSSVPDGRLRSRGDTGPPMVRRRSSAMNQPIVGTMEMTTVQWTYLIDTFWKTTTLGGSLPFNFPDPWTGSLVPMMFGERPPVESALGGDYYMVTLDLEKFP